MSKLEKSNPLSDSASGTPTSSPAPVFSHHQLTRQILIAMAAGIAVGVLINLFLSPIVWVQQVVIGGVFYVGGKVFVSCLQLLVVPLVLVSLISGTAALEDVRRLGSVGLKTMALYLVTTALAITLALAMASLLQPGRGIDKDRFLAPVTTVSAEQAPQPARSLTPPLTEVLINIVPSNPIESMATGNMLQIIVFAILFGIALTLAGEPGQRVLSLVNDLNEVVLKLVMLLMRIAPVGVFCLISQTFATQGFGAILPLSKYFGVVLLCLLLHGVFVCAGFLKLLAGLHPGRFLRKMWETQVFAFSTSSSNATIPVTLETVTKRMGVHPSVASFTVPLGATINMDGTAIMQGVATVFIAQAWGIDLTLTDLLVVIVTATLASIGTAGVPGVGLVMLSMVLTQVGLPVEGIAIIMGVDRLLDMVRTAVNITGDSMVSCVVGKWQGKLDEQVFDLAD